MIFGTLAWTIELYMTKYIIDDVLQDFFLSEITISYLWSLDVEKHFDLALASPRNVQIHFFYQVHKIISVLYSAISEALNFVYIRRVIYNSAFKKIKNKLKMPRNCNFCPILDLVTLNVFVFNGNKRNQANSGILILKNSIFWNWICTFRGGASVKLKWVLNFRDIKKEMFISEKRKSSSTSSNVPLAM